MRAYHALTFQRNATFFFVPERRKARYDNGCPASALEGTPCPGKRGLWKDIVDHIQVWRGRGCASPPPPMQNASGRLAMGLMWRTRHSLHWIVLSTREFWIICSHANTAIGYHQGCLIPQPLPLGGQGEQSTTCICTSNAARRAQHT